MKKAILTGVVATILVGMLAVPVSAHGGHSRGTRHTQGNHNHTQYAVCTVAGCNETGLHEHNGITYRCAGVAYPTCTVDGCTQTGLHKHDGTTYSCGTGACAGNHHR